MTYNKPLTRLSLIARPNEGITVPGTRGTNADSPSLHGPLGDMHPVRDVVKAVSGTVKKVLGVSEDNAGATGGNAAESGAD